MVLAADPVVTPFEKRGENDAENKPSRRPNAEEAQLVRADRFGGRSYIADDRHVQNLARVQRLIHLRGIPMRRVEREALGRRVDAKVDKLEPVGGGVQHAQRLVDRLRVRFVLSDASAQARNLDIGLVDLVAHGKADRISGELAQTGFRRRKLALLVVPLIVDFMELLQEFDPLAIDGAQPSLLHNLSAFRLEVLQLFRIGRHLRVQDRDYRGRRFQMRVLVDERLQNDGERLLRDVPAGQAHRDANDIGVGLPRRVEGAVEEHDDLLALGELFLQAHGDHPTGHIVHGPGLGFADHVFDTLEERLRRRRLEAERVDSQRLDHLLSGFPRFEDLDVGVDFLALDAGGIDASFLDGGWKLRILAAERDFEERCRLVGFRYEKQRHINRDDRRERRQDDDRLSSESDPHHVVEDRFLAGRSRTIANQGRAPDERGCSTQTLRMSSRIKTQRR